MTPLRRRLAEDMQVRNPSPCSQDTYIRQVSLFARQFGKSPDLLGPEQIRECQVRLAAGKRLAPGSIGVAVAALPVRRRAAEGLSCLWFRGLFGVLRRDRPLSGATMMTGQRHRGRVVVALDRHMAVQVAPRDGPLGKLLGLGRRQLRCGQDHWSRRQRISRATPLASMRPAATWRPNR